MQTPWTRLAVRSLALAAACLVSWWPTTDGSGRADAQVKFGDFWLVQPHQSAPVGRVWTNASRTVEYWVFVDGEYRWATAGNGPQNRWRLEAEFVASADYPNLAAFREAVCDLPQFEGKTLVFQDHSVVETVVEN